MTDEEINAAIDKVMGKSGCQRGGGIFEQDWCGDLNAMHEAENGLNKNLRNQYIDWLGTIHTDSWEFATATARQRAEAFLRVLGKWEEKK